MRNLQRLGVFVVSVVLLGGIGVVVGVGGASGATAPTVVTGTASSIKPTSVVLSGEVDPNGSATSWYVEYGPSTSSTLSSQTAPTAAGSRTAMAKVSVKVAGLSEATSYTYRFVASSASSGVITGASATFNTTAGPTIVTGAASRVTVSSATLNAVVNPEGLTTHTYFQYGATTALGAKTATTTLAAGPNNAAIADVISGLAIHTTYYFRIVATNSAGTSIGGDLSFTTGRSVTMNASSSTAVYGQFITLSGSIISDAAGQHVTISAERYNQSSFSGLASVVTGANGTWSYRTQPAIRTTYVATGDGGTSSAVVLSVRPVVDLATTTGGRLTTKVVGATSFSSHVLQLQRLSKGNWVTWKSVRLNSHAKATFSTSLPKGKTHIRMAIGPFVPGIDQAAPGYLAGFSRTIIYTAR